MISEYKKFKIERLDSISPTFCAAKWLRMDLYLHTGVTSSCNFPKPGPIDFSLIDKNVLAIHNTTEKLQQRKEMLSGIQPSLCSNCWNVENSDPNTLSHRIPFSHRHKNVDFSSLDLSDKIVPEFITIAFDSFCNFTCSYCDATQSSSWATDLKTQGPYKKIKTDAKKTYQRLGSQDLLDEQQYDYLYQKTLQMIRENIQKIKTINLLGGEPTMSPVFWKFMDWLSTQDSKHISVRIITNLSHPKLVDRLLHYRSFFRMIRLGVSIDGYQQKAEFIRHGLEWSHFETTLNKLLCDIPDIEIDLLGTVNILALDGLEENLNWYSNLREKFPERMSIIVNAIRWPEFQAITVLPDHLKQHYAGNLKKWIQDHFGQFDNEDYLLVNIDSIITLLELHATLPNVIDLQKDFKTFVVEFARRRKLDIRQTFSKILTDWILEDNHE